MLQRLIKLCMNSIWKWSVFVVVLIITITNTITIYFLQSMQSIWTVLKLHPQKQTRSNQKSFLFFFPLMLHRLPSLQFSKALKHLNTYLNASEVKWKHIPKCFVESGPKSRPVWYIPEEKPFSSVLTFPEVQCIRNAKQKSVPMWLFNPALHTNGYQIDGIITCTFGCLAKLNQQDFFQWIA